MKHIPCWSVFFIAIYSKTLPVYCVLYRHLQWNTSCVVQCSLSPSTMKHFLCCSVFFIAIYNETLSMLLGFVYCHSQWNTSCVAWFSLLPFTMKHFLCCLIFFIAILTETLPLLFVFFIAIHNENWWCNIPVLWFVITFCHPWSKEFLCSFWFCLVFLFVPFFLFFFLFWGSFFVVDCIFTDKVCDLPFLPDFYLNWFDVL